MTREETKRIVLIIKKTYPNWDVRNDQDLADRITIWSKVFEEDDYEAIEAGLFNYIQNDTSGFAPAPGQIRNGIKQVVEAYDDTEEAIADLRNALTRSNYYWTEEFEKLSPSLQRAVGQAENLRAWAALDQAELESVVLSHVRRAYRNVRKQEDNIRTMQPIRNEMLEQAKARRIASESLNRIEQKPAGLIGAKAPDPAPEYRKTYEPKLTSEERDLIIRAWNRNPGKMILTDLMISPKRDQKLRDHIDRAGLDEVLRREGESDAQTFGAFLDELEVAG